MGGKFGRYALIWILLLLSVYLGERLIRNLLLAADEPRAVAARGSLSDGERATIELFQNVAPSVVYILAEGGRPGEASAGSGFVWDRAGHIVTNHHVIEGARRVAVRMDDGTLLAAQIVGSAPDYDLAVVRLSENRQALAPIPIGTSADLKVGQAAFAIGNPFGLSRTLTGGIVSALNRRLPTAQGREVRGAIQTDAAINPGNSGGPLLDSAGRLIGVNTAIFSESGGSVGVGVAVPVDVVNRIVPQLIRDGRVPRPSIGIAVLDEEATARQGVDGLVIVRVIPGSPAARAGLRGVDLERGRLGDVIVKVNGEDVRTSAEFAAALDKAGIGSTVRLTVRRDGRPMEVTVTVADMP
ncbi:MAG TPA: trypsin-like peptidase domain-containing protein [Alphaproteobacteria bacterium]